MIKTRQKNYKITFSTLTIKNSSTANKIHTKALEVRVVKIKSTIKNLAAQVLTNEKMPTQYSLWDWD